MGSLRLFLHCISLLVLLFGAVFGDHWESIVKTGHPRSDHSVTMTTDTRYLLIFGGYTGPMSPVAKLLKYDLEQGTFVDIQSTGEPSARIKHTAVQTADNKMIVFGGYNSQKKWLNEVYVYDVASDSWQLLQVTGSLPDPRVAHSAVLVDNKMVVFGGNNVNGFINNVFKLDLSTKVWTKVNAVGTPPEGRIEHSAVVLPKSSNLDRHDTTIAGYYMVVFGGARWHGPDGYMNDIFTFDLGTNTWKTLPAEGDLPSRRVGTGAIALSNGYEMVIYSGYNIDGIYEGDVRHFNLATNTWIEVFPDGSAPEDRWRHQSVIASGSDQMIMFAGFSDKDVKQWPGYRDDLLTLTVQSAFE